MAAFRAIGLVAAAGLAAALPASAQQVVDLFGVNQATFVWTPASGSVAGYYVIVTKNGSAPALYGVSSDPSETVQSATGDTITVSVAAFDGSGVAGPVSLSSDPIRFNAAPSTGGSGGTTTPPPSSDPTTTTGGSTGGPTSAGGGSDPATSVAAATRFDFSGDGRSDLLLRDLKSGAVTLWTMQETQVTARASWPQLAAPWRIATTGDFDGDGTADVLWRNTNTGALIAWRAQAGAIVGGNALDVPGITLDRTWKVQGSADFDGDGRDDIVLVNPSRGAVELLLMNGTSVASHVSRTAPTPDWRVIAMPDADGDGIAEIVWHNTRTHDLAIEALAAPGAPVALPTEARRWRVLSSGDMDGDGRDDLLMQNRQTGLVQTWLLNGAKVTPTGVPVAPPSGALSLRGLGDFDGDGRADAFWQNLGGNVEIWFSTAQGAFESGKASETTGGATVVGDNGA